MSVPCPKCNSPLNSKGLKPGKYKPKCPKCGTVFLLVVPDDPEGTLLARLVPDGEKSAPVKAPDPRKAPTAPGGRALGGGDPNVTGDFTEGGAAADPNATGNFTEPAAYDAGRTGDFTEASGDPQRTGDFTPKQPAARGDKTDIDAAPGRSKKGDDDDFPDKLGGYEVIKVLGKGGMGAVLLGRQVSLDRKVALKIMHPRLSRDPTFVARFVREAYAAAQLTHHNVIQIYDIGEDRGTHFFSMEFVDGKSLMDVVKKDGKIDAEMAVGYILQAARGLKYGHNQGMVHRDIKPDNLMVNTEGVVKVADLGLVKVPGGDGPAPKDAPVLDDDVPEDGDTQKLTRVGSVMGTPAYMAPEQARDSSGVDGRADIYSLGCSLYVMLTGKPPFEGKTALEVISKHQTQPLVPPEAIVKRVPKALSGILQKMLAKKPEDRYQSMDEVIVALQGFLGENQAGPFSPKEEHADALEKSVAAYNGASKGGLKKALALAFFAACIVGIIACGVAGKFLIAGGVLGLMVMAPVAYFLVSGTQAKTYLFGKVRELALGAKFTDWLMYAGGLVLFLGTLYIFGLLWYWLGFCVLAVGLAFVLSAITDKAEEAARDEPLTDAKQLFKAMRLQGLDEESLRQFVCKFGGENWEPLYEALFGFEAKLAARAYRKGAVAEIARKHAAWREPVVGWIDTRLQHRREEAERKHLLQVQTKALQAEGVSAADAKQQAEELADVMVGQAQEVRTAVRAGKTADVRNMMTVARIRKRPPAGYNIAGVPLRTGPRPKDYLNRFVGRRLRFLLGAAVFAVGLLWLNQNKAQLNATFETAKSAAGVVAGGDIGNLQEAGSRIAGSVTKVDPTKFTPLSFLPESLSHAGLPLGGFMMMLAGVFYFGWKPTLTAVPGLLICVLAPMFGVPWYLGAALGFILILVAGRFLRE